MKAEEDRVDAERYRWLRDSHGGEAVLALFRREWDSAIDAELAKEASE